MRTLFRRSFFWLIPASLVSAISRKEGSSYVGSRTGRALLATPVLLLMVSASASADNVNIFLGPNTGNGGNVVFSSSGPAGFGALIFGGTETYSWDDTGFNPGTSFASYSMPVDIEGGSILVNGVTFDYDNFDPLGPATLQILNSFTLPSNGRNFTTPVQMEFEAAVLLSNGIVTGVGGIASGTLTFDYYAPLNIYFVESTQLTSTPEPGAFFLTATGITGLAGLWMKRRRHA